MNNTKIAGAYKGSLSPRLQGMMIKGRHVAIKINRSI